ncbi:MAG: hypothetical protein U1A28_03080 [Patescibacteria group bacterium]|nr:hypothetical protein [Patescibacteria group bacterium]
MQLPTRFHFTSFLQRLNVRLFGRVLLVSVLIFTLAVPASMFLAPQRADALATGSLVETIEIGPELFSTIESTIQDILHIAKEYGLVSVGWVIAQKLIQKITKDLVKWVQSGFDGAPAFATDFEGTLLDVANAVGGDFILGIKELAWLCSPYSFDIRFTLAIQMQQFRDKTPTCTITGVVDRFEKFLEGDFLSGGWEGWFQLTQQPTNNIYGSFLTARGGLVEKLAGAKERKINLLDWGHGFLAWTECPVGTTKVKQGQTETCLGGTDDGKEAKFEPITQTPGKVISEQLNTALGDPKKKLVTADEINEIIGSLAAQLISTIFESAGGLFKSDSRRAGSSTSILDQLRGEKPEDYQTQKKPDEGETREGVEADINSRADGGGFRYSLTPESSFLRVNPGGTRSTTITKTLLEGTSKSTSVNVVNTGDFSGKGITVSGSNLACSPTCTGSAVIYVAATTPPGTYPIIIAGDPAPDGGNITITLEVTTATDTTPPTITSATELSYNGSVWRYAVAASDDFGVARVEGFLEEVDSTGAVIATGPTATDTVAPFEFDIFPPPGGVAAGGTVRFTFAAHDVAGNVSVPFTQTSTVPAEGGGGGSGE